MTFLAAIATRVLEWGIAALVSAIAAGIAVYVVRKKKSEKAAKEIEAINKMIVAAKTRKEMEDAARENARLNGPSN